VSNPIHRLSFAITAVFTGALLCIALAAQALAADDELPDLPLFASDSVLKLRIEGPLSTMLDERSNTAYYEGTLSYFDDAGAAHPLDLKFRTRGNKRRNPETCRFPPVRLNLQKKQVMGTVFEGQDKLKLVAPCNAKNDRYEQYVYLEYLAYKILQLHTPYAFRARLVQITWVDADDDNNSYDKIGFVIEHKNEMSARLGMELVELVGKVKHRDLNRTHADVATLFQYMIANTDFSLVAAAPGEECCHNSTLLSAESGELFPIPYDFDWSGLINAPYATPNPRFKARSVTTRVWRGHCTATPGINGTIAQFQAQRENVFALINNQQGLSDSTRKRATKFLTRFYEDISDSRKVQKDLHTPC